jgi:hypothetical protein
MSAAGSAISKSRCHCSVPNCNTVFSSSTSDTAAVALFPCGCNICGACAAALGEHVTGFGCPVCGSVVSEHLKNLALSLAGDADRVDVEGGTVPGEPTLCGECDEADHEVATQLCRTCDLALCEDHARIHKKVLRTSLPSAPATTCAVSMPATPSLNVV